MALSLIRRTAGTRTGSALCPLHFQAYSSTTCRLKLKSNLFYVLKSELTAQRATGNVTASRFLSASAYLHSETSQTSSKSSTAAPLPNTPTAEQRLPEERLLDVDAIFRERYIPVSRQSIIRQLSDEKDLLTDNEKALLPAFVRSLDTVLVAKYQGFLEELKALFDPINPDKDTQKSREWTKKEKLDSEYWLLHKLEDVMIKANFHELPKKKVEHFLKDHQAQTGVRVSVDPARYDVLRFWVLGHDIPELKPSLPQRMSSLLLRRGPAKPKEYFKRVVVALRLKKDSKLMLKAFKEVHVQSLEMLLPDGAIRMKARDRVLLAGTAGVACFGILAKVVTVLASLQVDWTLALALATGTVGFRVWTTYRNRRNAYLLDVSRTLYFKNIANNQGLLTLLVDRAEDESLKEVVLTYIFLLNSSSQNLFAKPKPDGLTTAELEFRVQKWLEQTTGTKIRFDSAEAIRLLQSLGLLVEKDNKFQALQFDVASRLLPQRQQSVIAQRLEGADITDSFKDEYLETDDKYKSEDAKARKYGWF